MRSGCTRQRVPSSNDLHDAAEEILRLTDKIRLAERQVKALTAEVATELMTVHGISSVVAAGLIGHAGDLRNYRNAGAFAAKCGAAPVPCSSGRHVAVRVNRGGRNLWIAHYRPNYTAADLERRGLHRAHPAPSR